MLVGAITMFFFSVITEPLANAIAADLVAPFAAAALSPIVLKGQFTWAVAGAVSLGFIGVVMVLRPDCNFDAIILWAIGAGLLFALHMLATRLAARKAPPLAALSYRSLLGALVLTLFVLTVGVRGASVFLGLFDWIVAKLITRLIHCRLPICPSQCSRSTGLSCDRRGCDRRSGRVWGIGL